MRDILVVGLLLLATVALQALIPGARPRMALALVVIILLVLMFLSALVLSVADWLAQRKGERVKEP